MGATCRTPQQQDGPNSTIQTSNLQGFQGIQFIFTVDKLTRLQTQCLILFTDKKLKISRNYFLQKCSSSIAAKVQQYLDVYMIQSKLLPGQCVILDAMIPQFSFNKICIVCLQVWAGKQKSQIQQPLRNCIQLCLRTIKQQNISSITMVQYNGQFGLPNSIADRALITAICNQQKGLKTIKFINNNVDTMIQIKKAVVSFRHPIYGKQRSQVSKDQSAYY